MTESTAASPPKAGFWLSGPNVAAAEICAALEYDHVVLDIEHGTFDLSVLERFIPVLHGLGLAVLAKVLGPRRGPVQQALDFGADGVVIPHIEDAGHAREVTRFAKFAPLGDRGFAGGRTARYDGVTDDWLTTQDSGTLCLPMIERAEALRDIDQILALDTVDGVFLGPSDMSLSRGRGAYSRTHADFADIITIADSAKSAGKPWMMCAWAPEELDLCLEHDADSVVLKMEHTALREGFTAGIDRFRMATGIPDRS